jgi:hypothetical protein
VRRAVAAAFDWVVQILGLVDRDGALHWRDGPQVWALGTKHDRRVYRMLRCVHNVGLDDRAQMLMRFLERELGRDPARADALAWYRHQLAS